MPDQLNLCLIERCLFFVIQPPATHSSRSLKTLVGALASSVRNAAIAPAPAEKTHDTCYEPTRTQLMMANCRACARGEEQEEQEQEQEQEEQQEEQQEPEEPEKLEEPELEPELEDQELSSRRVLDRSREVRDMTNRVEDAELECPVCIELMKQPVTLVRPTIASRVLRARPVLSLFLMMT